LFGGIAGEADPSVFEESSRPAPQHVIHRFRDIVVARQFAELATHPGFQIVHERRDAPLPYSDALLGRQTVDGTLGIEIVSIRRGGSAAIGASP
jgi:hypothetical protein